MNPQTNTEVLTSYIGDYMEQVCSEHRLPISVVTGEVSLLRHQLRNGMTLIDGPTNAKRFNAKLSGTPLRATPIDRQVGMYQEMLEAIVRDEMAIGLSVRSACTALKDAENSFKLRHSYAVIDPQFLTLSAQQRRLLEEEERLHIENLAELEACYAELEELRQSA